MSRWLKAVFASVAIVFAAACEPGEEETIPVLTVGTTLWKAGGGTVAVQVAATSTWRFEVEYSGGQSGWIHFDPVSGSGFGSSTMTVDANSGDSPRQATVFLRSPHYFAKAEISQSGGVMAGPQWLEMPAISGADGFGFFTHDMTGGMYVNSEKSGVRNWSFLWDYANHLSHWVAYPLNKGLIGKGSRSNQWGLDPLIPADQQPDVTVTYGGGWTRGHQIPSADRLDRDANISTFYATNMTPQDYDFNTYIWANLEQQVRNYSSKCDTLYVVTGCDIRGYSMSSGWNTGFSVPVPVAYYKALLRRKGNDYSALGFYLPHFPSDPVNGSYMDYILSIDELEEKTGVDFFVNLGVVVGESRADSIEAADAKETVKNW